MNKKIVFITDKYNRREEIVQEKSQNIIKHNYQFISR